MAQKGWRGWLEQIGWAERVFAVLLVLALTGWPGRLGNGVWLATWAVVVGLGSFVILRAGLRQVRKQIWWLRKRLLVAYVFIALVPILLLAFLIEMGALAVASQVSGYLLKTEIDRRIEVVRQSAQALAHVPEAMRADALRRAGMYYRERYPGSRVVLRERGGRVRGWPENVNPEAPPPGHGECEGLLLKDGEYHLWAHSSGEGVDVAVIVPVTRTFLLSLVPGLGEIRLRVPVSRRGDTPAARLHAPVEGEPPSPENVTTAAVNPLDLEIKWGNTMPVGLWQAPQQFTEAVLGTRTRMSSVYGVLFGRESTTADTELLLVWLGAFALGFLIVEAFSFWIGISLTRTIMVAVDALHEGTQRVMRGDLTHRIAVHGNDQLAELSRSFNRMTENLGQLLEGEKERQRLRAELEIAREVQSQLHPKPIQGLGSLRLDSVCEAARMVSGDYYDYQRISENQLALAIGDVAGKGISAALLMATLQSSMRSQLRQWSEAIKAGRGDGFSASRLISNLNQQVYASTAPEKFATFFFSLYDDGTSQLTYVNAGHLPPILVRRGQASTLDTNGMVVGAFPFASYNESRLELQRGDLLVLYTDGITEPENEYGEDFGEQRLRELLVDNADRDGAEITAEVMDAVRRWTAFPDELQDDMTLLVLRKL
jgi:sigma-B regulation protein RsbU (phosphoserine phosphatase)